MAERRSAQTDHDPSCQARETNDDPASCSQSLGLQARRAAALVPEAPHEDRPRAGVVTVVEVITDRIDVDAEGGRLLAADLHA